MASLHEMQRIDWELSSELVDPPVNPALIHMSVPLIGSTDQHLYLQINGEALWAWRSFWKNDQRIKDVLRNSLLPLGYRLLPSASDRVSSILRYRIYRLMVQSRALRNSKNSRTFRNEFWAKIAIEFDEIASGPKEMCDQFLQREKELAEERKELEGKPVQCNYYFLDKLACEKGPRGYFCVKKMTKKMAAWRRFARKSLAPPVTQSSACICMLV